MKRISFSDVGGLVLAVFVLVSLLVGTHYGHTNRETAALCQEDSEPELIRHRHDGFTKKAVIISHLRYYQQKFIKARINLRHSYAANESQVAYAQKIKNLAIVLSYWEYQYIKLKQQTRKDHRNLIHRA